LLLHAHHYRKQKEHLHHSFFEIAQMYLLADKRLLGGLSEVARLHMARRLLRCIF
jgi:hypothetical protein